MRHLRMCLSLYSSTNREIFQCLCYFIDMKYLGIDYGSKKVGIALSDETGFFAFPKGIIPTKDFFDYVLKLAKKEEIDGFVLGRSVNNQGDENTVMAQVKNFKEKLEQETKLPVVFEREDFSSVEAHRYQTDRGNRDDSAAAIILQRFLDKENRK